MIVLMLRCHGEVQSLIIKNLQETLLTLHRQQLYDLGTKILNEHYHQQEY